MSKATFNKNNQGEVVSFVSVMNPEVLQEALLERSKQAALAFAVELLEQEVEKLCGAVFARKTEGMCRRGGSESTSIVVGNQRTPVVRPRVRNEQGEVVLSTLENLRSQDLLDERIRQKMLLGVSSRKYGKVIDAYAESLACPGVQRHEPLCGQARSSSMPSMRQTSLSIAILPALDFRYAQRQAALYPRLAQK